MPQNGYYFFKTCGLHIRSMINLPELRPSAEENPAVTIRFGKVPLSLDNPTRVGSGFMATSNQLLLLLGESGRYLISDGREVIIDAPSDVDEKMVRFHLLGVCLRALLGQQERLVLHANVVLINGKAVALAGPSRAGKSTLTAFLYQAGCPLIGDDLCAVFVKDGMAYAHPGVPRFKLWEDSLVALGKLAHPSNLLHRDIRKYALPADKSMTEPVPLSRLMILQKGEQHTLTRLKGMQALIALGKQTLFRRKSERIAHFGRCAELAKVLPVCELTRPWDIQRLPETVSWLLHEA
jgi:hypothetical protein